LSSQALPQPVARKPSIPSSKPPVVKKQTSAQIQSKITMSAHSALPKSTSDAQVLEPQSIKYADSIESLANGSTGSFTGSSSSESDAAIAMAAAVKAAADAIEGWNDIDAADRGDEFTCSDYAEHIFKYYREREGRFVVDDYLKRQTNINKSMRLLLVDWMVEVQQQLEFNHEVLYLSVKLLDLYLNKRRIEKEKLQLLGGAAMFIACKFEVIRKFEFYII
jgi:hypothetical protein